MWPVPAHLSTRVPGTPTWAFDESTFLWNDWFLRHALLDLHASPLHSDLIWYPLGVDLILYTFNFTNASLALPLQLAANLPLASNVTLLLATALSGFGAYLLATDLMRGRMARDGRGLFAPANVAALLAGVIYAAGSNRAVYLALGHYNFASTGWLPFYTLYLLRTLARPGRKNALLAGLFFALAGLTDLTYASFLAIWSLLIVLLGWRTSRTGSAGQAAGRPGWAMPGRLALAGLAAALLMSPILVPTVREFARGGYALKGWGESLGLSVDVAGLLTPTNLNPLLAPPPAEPLLTPVAPGERAGWQAELRAVAEGKGRFADINTVFLGYLTLGLALLAVLLRATRRQARPWAAGALIFVLLCLGPLLQIGGRYRFGLDNLLPEGVTVPLPFIVLHFIPVLNANRAANRFSVLLMLALAVLAALGAWWLLDRVATLTRRRGLVPACGLVLAAVLVGEHLALPLPTVDATVPAIYRQIAAEPGDFSILQLPLGWRNSFETYGSEATLLQYYQSVSGKPIIGGNISRAPDFKLAYFKRIPLFQALTGLELYQDVPTDVDAAARAQAAALTALYDIRYLITFPPVPGRFPYYDTWQRTQAYALSVLPLDTQPIWEQDGVRAYRVRQPAVPFPFRLDLGTPGSEPYLGAGWDANLAEQPYGATATWVDGTTADMYLPLAGPTACTLHLRVAALDYPGARPQALRASVNDVPLAAQPLPAGWQTVTVAVPAAATRRGPNRVHLEFAWAASPRQVFPDPASRAVIGATGVTSPVNIDVHSFSEAFISVFDRSGGEIKASPGRRGYNVVVIDPGSGAVLDRQGFDTAANTYESDRLAAYLGRVRRGAIVAVAAKGDAAAYLTSAAVAGLRNMGAAVKAPADLAGRAYALVGVAGAAPGTAAEVSAPPAPDGAFLRVAGDFRTLSAAVDWVELGN